MPTILALLLLVLLLPAPSRLEAQGAAVASRGARTSDVGSLDAILAALYDVISGPAGQPRDWERMRALFHPGARFIPTGRSPDGARARASALTIDQYIETNGPWFRERGFFEVELARETRRYGQIAHVLSTYEARHVVGGPVAARGVNSIQLLFDGSRWWVLTVMWNPELPGEPLPGLPSSGDAPSSGSRAPLTPLPAVMPATPAEHAARRERLYTLIGSNVAILIGAPPLTRELPFAQDNNFAYLSGVTAPNAVLVLDGRSRTTTLYLPTRTPAQQAWEGPELIPGVEAARITGIADVRDRTRLLGDLALRLRPGDSLYIPFGAPEWSPASGGDATPVWTATRQDSLLGWDSYHGTARARLAARHPEVTMANLTPRLNQLRRVKDATELAHLRRASALAVIGVIEAIRSTEPGRTEAELATAAEMATRLSGAEGLAFPPILASGPNVNIIHHVQLGRTLGNDDLVLLDYGARDGGYMSDITRTWPSTGSFTPEQAHIYESVAMVRDSVLAAIRPGVRPSELLAIGQRIMRARGDTAGYWMNYLGHPVGMSTHDPNSGAPDAPWPEGFVFNIEPVWNDPVRGWHFRIEDTIVVTASGAEVLTAAAPTRITDLVRLRDERGLYESLVRRP